MINKLKGVLAISAIFTRIEIKYFPTCIFQQPSEDKKVTFDHKLPAKTVKIVFTPTTDGTVTVDSVEVDYCAEEGKRSNEGRSSSASFR